MSGKVWQLELEKDGYIVAASQETEARIDDAQTAFSFWFTQAVRVGLPISVHLM